MLDVALASGIGLVFSSVINGAGGEYGRRLASQAGALASLTRGRETRHPTTRAELEELLSELLPRVPESGPLHDAWAALVQALPPDAAVLRGRAELPPTAYGFTDREKVLRALTKEANRSTPSEPGVAVLYGARGVGTSATALCWGRRNESRFPDGRFYVDLRGVGGGERGPTPDVVLRKVLCAMGVARERLPSTEEGLAELYQRLLRDRKALVLVDHASSAAQVRPLVPTSPKVFLVVTASAPVFAMTGLGKLVEVPPMRDGDARRMLARLTATDVVADNEHRLPTLLEQCAGNVYALTLLASRLVREASEPEPSQEPPMADPVREAVLRTSARLPSATARLCRLTALAGWHSFGARMSARAADVPVVEAEEMLGAAESARLVERTAQGYRFRPGVREVLAEAAGAQDGGPACSTAVARMLEELLDRARYAAHAALPESWRVEEPPGASGHPDQDPGAGVAMLLEELDNLLRAVFLADEYGHVDQALSFARALWPLQLKAGRCAEVLPALRRAVELADSKHPGTRASAALHFQVSHCLGEQQRYEEADAAAVRALEAERAAGHPRGQASCVEQRGLLRLGSGRRSEAWQYLEEAKQIYLRIAPGEEGSRDVPRALALIDRHQGRALRVSQPAQARLLLERALEFFAPSSRDGEAYNRARVLTDLAETLLDLDEQARAERLITEAEELLRPQLAGPHLDYLAALRTRCQGAS